MKGAGVRDTARVLGISTNTVLAHLKTRPTDSKLLTARGWCGGARFRTHL
ncbi:IS1-like element transposase [uncultured Thiothrix sp.]